MKRIFLIIVTAIVAVAAALVIIALVQRDRYSWATSRSLSAALQNCRSVVLVEHSGGVELARKSATPDEMSRLQKAISAWPRPFFPESYACWIPRHSIDIVRADGSPVSVDICFSCGKFGIEDLPFVAALPPHLAKSLTSFFASVGMAPKTDEEYTRIEISQERRPD
jgi:hypothetical protein